MEDTKASLGVREIQGHPGEHWESWGGFGRVPRAVWEGSQNGFGAVLRRSVESQGNLGVPGGYWGEMLTTWGKLWELGRNFGNLRGNFGNSGETGISGEMGILGKR